jgi:D-arabinose 1-dehydrogenase-like Zn-dependent alcohol dehydrogenase
VARFLIHVRKKIAVVLDVQENGNLKASIKNTCVLMNSDGTVDVMTKDSLKLAPMAPGSVVLEMVFSEVCGTDVHLQHGRLDMVPYPIIPGHVAVGKVYNVAGSVTDVEGSKVSKQASHIL